MKLQGTYVPQRGGQNLVQFARGEPEGCHVVCVNATAACASATFHVRGKVVLPLGSARSGVAGMQRMG
jgi:hypothetical protein